MKGPFAQRGRAAVIVVTGAPGLRRSRQHGLLHDIRLRALAARRATLVVHSRLGSATRSDWMLVSRRWRGGRVGEPGVGGGGVSHRPQGGKRGLGGQ
jgi:hypothetical protein